jgi:hypothetical protein
MLMWRQPPRLFREGEAERPGAMSPTLSIHFLLEFRTLA